MYRVTVKYFLLLEKWEYKILPYDLDLKKVLVWILK